MDVSVTVVIPTIGRQSVADAISSALNQSFRPAKILVIDDSLEQSVHVAVSPIIDVFRSGGGMGPSFSRNLGMGKSKTDWVAFLDDDDSWNTNHLEKLLSFCISNNLDAGYSSAQVNRRIRPKKVYEGVINPVVEIYQSSNWWKTKLYLPTPGLIISKNVVAHLPFNDNIREREDLWFAHKIFEYQFRVRQSADATVQINQNSTRSINRTNIESDLDWAQRLELISANARDNFLTGVAFRNACIRRDWSGIKLIAKMYSRSNLLFKIISWL